MGHAGKVAGWAALAFVAALLVRLPGIESRPFHTDEAVNAFIVGEALSPEGYHYQVNDHHGPVLFYLAAAVLRMGGVSRVAQMDAWMLRLMTVIAGAALVPALFLLRPALDRAAILWAALFIGLGAPFVYTSGSFIHESLLMLEVLLGVGALWQWRQTGSVRVAMIFGVIAGAMVATKESAVPFLMFLTPLFVCGSSLGRRARISGLLVAGAVAVGVGFLLFSKFGREPSRALDLLAALKAQAARGVRSGHSAPWWTYLRWEWSPSSVGIPWSGWLMAICAAEGLWLARSNAFIGRLGIWTLTAGAVECALPYKTPWLMLVFLLPLALVAGQGAALIWKRLPAPWVSWMAALVATALLVSETRSRCEVRAVDPRNPLAYAPSSADLVRLQADLELMASRSPERRDMLVQVVAEDYWPLPWTLRHFPQTGFWSVAPEKIRPGVLLSGPEALNRFPNLMPAVPYELRPGIWIFLAKIP